MRIDLEELIFPALISLLIVGFVWFIIFLFQQPQETFRFANNNTLICRDYSKDSFSPITTTCYKFSKTFEIK
jgi:hypothetical protein